MKRRWSAYPMTLPATKRQAECFVTGMQMEERACISGLERGQVWKIEHDYVHIVELSNHHIHYVIVREHNQQPKATRLIGFDALLNYLHQSQAELVDREVLPAPR
jgi:hypothetical protein